MRLGTILTAFVFLAVALAAGMWPSWSLASSLGTSPRPATVSVEAPATKVEPAVFKPCYKTVRAMAVSCFLQLGLPDDGMAKHAKNPGHCVPSTPAHALKTGARDIDPRPPRLASIC